MQIVAIQQNHQPRPNKNVSVMKGQVSDLGVKKKKAVKDINGATGKHEYKLILENISVSVWNLLGMITVL